MLKKEYRFHSQNRVKRVYQKGKTVKSGPFSLKYLEQATPQSTKAAVVVSKKVDKRAVVRNRIRRRIYEILRNKWNEISPGYDLVFTVFNNSTAKEDHAKLLLHIDKLLESAKVLQNAPPEEKI